MLKLVSVEILLVALAIFGNEITWNCYEDYQECVPESNKTDYVNIDNVESHNLIEFCFSHTQNILPCLAAKLGLTKDMSVSTFSVLLAICNAETQNNKSVTIEAQQTLKYLARLYAYFCAYSNILDLHRNTECFRNLMKYCVLNTPNDSCMFYHCAKVSLNLLKPHQTVLPTQQHRTTAAIDHYNQLSINRQDRITPIVTTIIIIVIITIIAFIGAIR